MAKKSKKKNKDKKQGPAGLSTKDMNVEDTPKSGSEDKEETKEEVKEVITHPEKPPKGMIRVETKTRVYSPVNGMKFASPIEKGSVVDISESAAKAKEFEPTKKGLTKDIPYSKEFTK